MNIVLALFIPLVVAVSGDEDQRVNGSLKGSVLLPCNCSQRSGGFAWQMDTPPVQCVFVRNDTSDTCSYSDSYKGRARVFKNCSLLLINLTKNDAGNYRCHFFDEGVYIKQHVIVTVDGQYPLSRNLTTHLTKSSKPKCDIMTESKPTNTTWTCNESKGNSSGNPTSSHLSQSRTHFACIPLMAAGLFMSLGAS